MSFVGSPIVSDPYGWPEPPGGGGFGWPGVDIPGTGMQATVCPPGTACSGPSISLPGGISGCLGSCYATPDITEPGVDPEPDPFGGTGGEVCPPGTHAVLTPGEGFLGIGGFTCELDNGNGGPAVLNGQNGMCACGPRVGAPAPCTCCLPGGGKGVTNKSRYLKLKGKCLDPSNIGNYVVVQPGTKCTKRRQINPANAKAATRAMSRVNRSLSHMKKLEKAVRKAAGPSRRRSSK